MIPQATAGFSDDAQVHRTLEHGRTLLGPGWRCVDSFDDINEDAYEDDEEEEYVLMDLGTSVDTRTLQTEATYQLIGLDTPIPFLKIGENVFEGRVNPLIGDEVVFDVVRQEDSQRPHYRPLLKTRSRIEFRGISLVERGTAREVPPPQTPKISGALDRGMFPTRRRRIPEEERAAEELKKAAASKGTSTPLRRSGRRSQAAPTVADLTADPGAGPSVVLTTGGVEAEMVIDLEEARRGDIADEDMAEDAPEDTADSSPGKKRSPSKGKSASKAMPKPKPKPSPKAKPKTKGKGKEKATDDVEMAEESETPAPAPVEEVEEDLEAQTSEIDVTPTVVRRRGGPGRPRGRRQDPSTPRMVRAAVAVSSLADLADIAYAGGLGPSNIRLDVAPNADAELLAAVAAVRKGQPWTPGSKLTPSQEERLLRNLPASGPGSRGGRRGSGVGRGRGRGRGRPATRRRPLHSSGMGLGDDFFGVGSSKDGAENAENDEGEEDDGDHFEDDDGEEGEHEEMEVDES